MLQIICGAQLSKLAVKIFTMICDIYNNHSVVVSIDIGHDELFLKTGRYPVLTVISAGHSLHVFINGHHTGNFKLIVNPTIISLLNAYSVA